MKAVEVKTYKYDELPEDARQRAREWFAKDWPLYDWWESTYDDFVEIGNTIGIDFKNKSNNPEAYKPAIYFSGFHSQGDGASFEGDYAYKAGWRKKLEGYCPNEKDLFEIAENLQEIQRRHFYMLSADIKLMNSIYCHSGTITLDVFKDGEWYNGPDEDELSQLMREFADWMYKRLEMEYEFLTSEEHIEEEIRINEYDFTEDGKVFLRR